MELQTLSTGLVWLKISEFSLDQHSFRAHICRHQSSNEIYFSLSVLISPSSFHFSPVNGFHSGGSPLHHVEHSHNSLVRKSSTEPQVKLSDHCYSCSLTTWPTPAAFCWVSKVSNDDPYICHTASFFTSHNLCIHAQNTLFEFNKLKWPQSSNEQENLIESLEELDWQQPNQAN